MLAVAQLVAPPKSPVPRALRGGAGAYFTKRATIKVEAGLVVILLRSCRLSSSLYALGRRPVHPVLPGPCPCPARRVQRSLGQTLSRSQIADFEVREAASAVSHAPSRPANPGPRVTGSQGSKEPN